MFDRGKRLKQAGILTLGLLLCALSFAACGSKGSPDASATPGIAGTAIPKMTIVTPTPGLPLAPGATPT
jgi:hypothetical protein